MSWNRSRIGRSARFTAAVLLAGAAAPAKTRAQVLPGLTLEWSAPAPCPHESALLEMIRAHLRDPAALQRRWSARARVTSHGDRYRLELDLHSDGAEAHRSLEGEQCEALADAAALLIALALDPNAELAPNPSAHEQLPAPDASAVEANTGDANAGDTGAGDATAHARPQAGEDRTARAAAQERGRPAAARTTAPNRDDSGGARSDGGGDAIALGFEAGAALQLDFGTLPQTPAFGLSPRLGLRLDALRVRVGLTLWPRARSRSETYPNAQLDGSGLTFDAALCFEIVRAPIALAPCAAGELGRLELASHGIQMPASSSADWTAAGVAMHGAYPLAGGLHAALDVAALLPFSRPRWWVETAQGDAALFTAARVSIRVSAGFAYVFE